jgi:hypothetical protein
MSTTELQRRKRDARSRTIVRRGELLTATSPVCLDRAFLERLHRQDPKLELHWHPLLERFILYRNHSARSKKQSDDLLVMEWDLDGQRPGNWLLDWLRWADKFAGGAVSPGAARRKYLASIDKAEEDWEEQWDKKRREMSEDVAKHLKWCIDGRTSVVSDWGKRRYVS